MFGWGKRRAERIAAKFEELDRVEDRLEDAWSEMLAERPPATDAGVDLALVTAADPAFDAQAFLAVARESYFQMREAWEQRNASIASGLCTPEVRAELQAAVAADAAAARRHLLPGVEISTAVIKSATVSGREISLVVRIHLVGKEHYVDDAFNIVSGDDEYHTWDEDWTFVRDMAVDESAEDREHALLREEQGGWDFAHRGWNVASIARVGAPVTPA
jgi:predicted lipid-binding transport protein (Tim44 family)